MLRLIRSSASARPYRPLHSFYSLILRENSGTPSSANNHKKEEADSLWTAEENLALQVAVQKFGPNWAKVVTILPTKTPLQIKTRWKSMMLSWRKDSATDRERKLLGSKKLVALAMASNFTICIGKFGAAVYTGSSSLLSESVHSLMDMINQGLLLIGIQRSLKQPNVDHPYGFHKEQYAWAMISAMGILFVGGGVPVASGISSMISPPSMFDIEHLRVAYAILGTALIFEGYTASKAFFQVKHNAEKAGITFWEYVLRGADSSSVQVLLEDSSSILGTIVAGTSLGLTYYLQNPLVDSIGSIVIGGLLSSVAIFLIRRNMKMVIETSMPSHRLALVNRIILSDPVIELLQDVKTSSLGPEHARFKAEIAINSKELVNRYLSLKEISMNDELLRIKSFDNAQDLRNYLSEFGGGVIEQVGDEIDRIEENIKDIVPEIKYVDLEVL